MNETLDKPIDIQDNSTSDGINSQGEDFQTETESFTCSIPPTPSIIHPEYDEKANTKEMKEKEKFLKKNLAKYGITDEEWSELEKYTGSEYFIPTTLLHRIDLFQYNNPRYGGTNLSILSEPEELIELYCRMYSAMCKFAKRNNKELHINRVDSDMFSDEMKKSGRTESLLSFSQGEYKFDFTEGKEDILFMKGVLEKGTPCIDLSALRGEDGEKEVLLPPFLTIHYDNKSTIYDSYTEYDVHISQSKCSKLSDKEKEKMQILKQSIIKSDIPFNYYNHWRQTIKYNPHALGNDEKSMMLKQEFFKWQDDFKEYLQLKFREIQYAIEYPQLKSTDFLTWGIARGQKDIGSFRNKIQQAGDFIRSIFRRNERDR